MGNIGPRHIATDQHGLRVVRTDTGMERCPTTAWANDPKITGTRIATVSQEQRGHDKTKEEQDHLFLSFTFVIIVSVSFLAETTCFVNPLEEPLGLESQKSGSIFEINFLEYAVG